ncbi:MAG: hypothetical protein JOZ46_01330 [Candidatus Dormibacteraeota bacterium]|nr:hypothetical protein [Candidatus Dormibacteraeota bacterium]MBV9524436.1 hypothetical protein [Candidatus Dormibacteraeota bacterium]
MEFDDDRARLYIGSVRWQFATTMPQWPHEYTVRHWRTDLVPQFEAFAEYIRSAGVIKPWPRDAARPRYHHTYLALDGWEYWTMGEPIAETVVINRALLDAAAAQPNSGQSLLSVARSHIPETGPQVMGPTS